MKFSYSTGKFKVRIAPPDTNGAVSELHYVQWVNTSFAVFEKKGGVLKFGPVQGKMLWRDFDGGPCENANDGDPIAQYDKVHKRWILAQFVAHDYRDSSKNEDVAVPPHYQCIAVSETSDPLGKYRRFRFRYDYFNDFPKLSVWPDAYYVTFNLFKGDYQGSLVCAYDKDVMMGNNTLRPPTQQCVQLPAEYFSLLPADVDGLTQPPAGAPNYLLSLDGASSSILLWKFRVDWEQERNSTFTGPIKVAGVESFEIPCGKDPERRACIPQRDTEQVLESLADRLNYRVAYRRFSNYESLVFNHSVATPAGAAALRWYELRNPSGAPTIYQSGTFAPDGNSRWLASIAMDKKGNIGIGYTVSGRNMSPALYFAGHDATDPQPGRLQKETPIVINTGSQMCVLPNGQCAPGCLDPRTGECITALQRWGDYSSLSVDPSDDCTMWYTAQYLKSHGGFNWSTKIVSFKFRSCI